MPQIKYIQLPIYSICCYGQYIWVAGGGGGTTGIPNEILIYNRQIKAQPCNRLSTDQYIIENMIKQEQKNWMICSANNKVVLYAVKKSGLQLQFIMNFIADYSLRNATINSICFCSNDGSYLCVGGNDMTIRIYKIGQQTKSHQIQHSYDKHAYAIKKVSYNQQNLILSNDYHLIVIYNLKNKTTQKVLYHDQIKPIGSLIQAAYFKQKCSDKLIILNYIARSSAYLSVQNQNNIFTTIKVNNDQSCASDYNLKQNVLGICCGQGTTYIFDNKLRCLSYANNHNFVITACTISDNFLYTGTPKCSFYRQSHQNKSIWTKNNVKSYILLLFSLIITLLFMKYFISGVNTTPNQL